MTVHTESGDSYGFTRAVENMKPHVFPLKTALQNGEVEYFGITKRELFAAMALQGILARGTASSIESRAMAAIDHADALLAALYSVSDEHQLETNHGDRS